MCKHKLFWPVILVLVFLVNAGIALQCFSQESIAITTYYPSAFGVYSELRAKRVAIGDTYYDSSQHCWSGGSCAAPDINDGTDLVVEGNVGIGTTSPTSKLHVIGKATFTGGIDPPYISFSEESHESIRRYAKGVEEHEKVMQFWNGEAHMMEVYVISEDKIYTITGELVEE